MEGVSNGPEQLDRDSEENVSIIHFFLFLPLVVVVNGMAVDER